MSLDCARKLSDQAPIAGEEIKRRSAQPDLDEGLRIEGEGFVRAVITQNIDRLHRLAGTERLIEVHGSIDQSVCMQCGGKVHIDRVVELLKARDGAPLCEACAAPL